MAVEGWDPRAAEAGITPRALRRLVRAAYELDAPRFGLAANEVVEFAPLARHADWRHAAESLPDDELIALIRLYTLAEDRLPGWEAGAHSPVVPLAALLKARGRYPAELTAWIKSNSDNRFLPYGDLMSRL